jgi:hypothetical protein
MNIRLTQNLLAVLLVFLILAIMVLLGGCATTYHAERRNADDGSYTVLDVKSRREFSGGVTIHYNKETGTFDLAAGDVSNGYSPLEEMAANLIPALIGARTTITTSETE